MARALKKPRAVCPFSGDDLEFVETSAGVQVRGNGWISSKFFADKGRAQWYFSHSVGAPPEYKKPWPDVQVIGEVEPELPEVADLVANQGRQLEGLAQDAANVLEGSEI